MSKLIQSDVRHQCNVPMWHCSACKEDRRGEQSAFCPQCGVKFEEVVLRDKSENEELITPRFVRMRKKWRTVMAVPSHLSELAPKLRQKNFYPIILPAGPLTEEQKGLNLSARTLVTDKPDELYYDVPVFEFSLIDISEIKADEAAVADIISHGWTDFRLRTEGWFVLRLREDGNHEIEFPE